MTLSKEKVSAILFISFSLLQFVKGQIGQITWDTSYSAYNQFVTAKTIIDQDSTFGVQIEYYPNGNIQYLINRKDGELHGHYISFNDDGSLRSYKFYRYGEALIYQIYHKKSIEFFEVKNGVKEGKYTKKDYDGNILEEGYYHNNILYEPKDNGG